MSLMENNNEKNNNEKNNNKENNNEKNNNQDNQYDLIIVGGGPAGLTAALYAARYKINTLLITKEIGGYAATAHKVCNFPSYPEISGFELMKNMMNHVKEFDIKIITNQVKNIKKTNSLFEVETDQIYKAKKVIYSAGTKRRELNIKGEKELYGRGVSYCATCDAAFFKDKIVAVVGGSDSALTASLLLSEYASKVYIIYRKDKFTRAEPTWIELVEKNEKIECVFNEEVQEIQGEKVVENLKLKSQDLKVNGIFIEIGSAPDLSPLNFEIENKNNYIITDTEQRTNVKGFFAAGDITNINLKQIITAASQGAIAAFAAYNELKKD